MDAKTSHAAWRVAKKLLPGQSGTLKLSRRFGDRLLCVRYRVDPASHERCTTVELVVDRSPINARRDRTVAVPIAFDETELRGRVKQHGATWDAAAKVWRMPARVATALGLRERVVEDA